MKKIILSLLFISSLLMSDTYVKGYYRSNGTYVNGYTRSDPDSYRYNNYGSKSNGGRQRDEYSNPGATNRPNPSYGLYDNDNDGISNSFDRQPNKKSFWQKDENLHQT
jgi:hypothetical protein